MDEEKFKEALASLDRQLANPNLPPQAREALKNMRTQMVSDSKALLPASQVGDVGDKMGDLSQSLLDPNSKFYQEYASYLQKTMPGIGSNTLLSPLMAGGTGYAGGQTIANQKLQSLSGQRQDKVNTGVQGFALGNIGLGAGLLGQQAGAYGQQAQLGQGFLNYKEGQRQYDDQSSGWNQFFNMLGQGAGLLNPFGGGGNNAQVAGYGNSAQSQPARR